MQDQTSTVSFCPSFNSYSSDRLSAIADRVSKEERLNTDGVDLDQKNHNHFEITGDDDDFEFVLVRANPDDFTVTSPGGDEVMASYPIFPVFNRDLLLDYENDYRSKDREDEKVSAIRLPLGKLFIDDRDPPSSSSSEADELEGLTPGTYCVWTPSKSPSNSPPVFPSPSRCTKSNSTGSSSKQKWRLRDLLHLRRSNSDGKGSLIFFNSDSKNVSESNFEKRKGKITTAPAPALAGKAKEKVSAHEVFYVRNKALKEGDKRRSYLPYRQGLVGFFSNVNGVGRTFPPF